MASGDWWQSLTAQQGYVNAQQAMQNIYTTTGSSITFNTVAGTGYVVGVNPPTPKVKAPETALEWLDRRVEEMRVSL